MTTDTEPTIELPRGPSQASVQYNRLLDGAIQALPLVTYCEVPHRAPITVYTALSRLIAARSRLDKRDGRTLTKERICVKMKDGAVSLRAVKYDDCGDPIAFKPQAEDEMLAFLLLCQRRRWRQSWHLPAEWHTFCVARETEYPAVGFSQVRDGDYFIVY